MLPIAASWIATTATSVGISALYYIAYGDMYGVPGGLYAKLAAAALLAASAVLFAWGMKTLGKALPGVTFKSYVPVGVIGCVLAGVSFTVVKRQAFTVLGLGYFETALVLAWAGMFIVGLWVTLETLHLRKRASGLDHAG